MIELSINKEDVARVQNMLAELDFKKRDGAIEKGLKKASSTVLKELVANVSGMILKRRTGALAKSMGWRIEGDKFDKKEAIIGSGATLKTNRMVYANILETGGVIKPVKARMLAIPIGKALTPAGVARFRPRQITSNGYTGSFIKRSKAGNLILFGSTKTKIVPLFVLKDSVTIPAFSYMADTVMGTSERVVLDIIDKIKEVKEKR